MHVWFLFTQSICNQVLACQAFYQALLTYRTSLTMWSRHTVDEGRVLHLFVQVQSDRTSWVSTLKRNSALLCTAGQSRREVVVNVIFKKWHSPLIQGGGGGGGRRKRVLSYSTICQYLTEYDGGLNSPRRCCCHWLPTTTFRVWSTDVSSRRSVVVPATGTDD